MKYRIFIVCCVILAICGLYLIKGVPQDKPSQNPPQIKIGVVSIAECFQKYKLTEEIKKQLEDDVEKHEKWAKQVEEQLRNIYNAYTDAETQEMKNRKYIEYRQTEIEYKARMRLFRKSYLKKVEDAHVKIYNDIRAAVEIVAEEQEFNIVLKVDVPWLEEEEVASPILKIHHRPVLYWRKAHDITKNVVERLNADYQKEKGGVKSLVRKKVEEWEKAAKVPLLPAPPAPKVPEEEEPRIKPPKAPEKKEAKK